MSVTLPSVPSPPPGLGPWMRAIANVLTQLDGQVNPAAVTPGAPVKASSLTSRVAFPDMTPDLAAPNPGRASTAAKPYMLIREDLRSLTDLQGFSGLSFGVGTRELIIAGPQPPSTGPNYSNYGSPTPGLRLISAAPFAFTNDSSYWALAELVGGQINLAANIVNIATPQDASVSLLGSFSGTQPAGLISIDVVNSQIAIGRSGVGTVISMNFGSTTASASNLNWNSATGVIALVSSMRAQKMDITDLDPECIMALRPVKFHERAVNEPLIAAGLPASDWIVGLIAEEVELAAPDLAAFNPDTKHAMGVDYERVGVAAVAKIQAQQKVIDAQQTVINGHEARILKLEQQVAALMTKVGL